MTRIGKYPLCALLIYLGFACDRNRIGTHDETPRLRGTVDLVIGEEDGLEAPTLFNDIRGITVDSQDRIVVADNQAGEVRLFFPDGRHAFTIGQPGKGPGDLQDPCCISIDAAGRLWVQEPTNQRYSVFELGDSTAEYLFSVPMPGQGSGQSDRVSWDQSGRVVHIAGAFNPKTMKFGLVRSMLDTAGNETGRDTLPEPPDDSLGFAVITGPHGGATGVNQPYGPALLRAFGPNGERAVAVSSRYAVSWVNSKGERIHLLQRDVEGPVVSDHEREEAEAVLVRLTKNLDVPRSSLPFDVPTRKTPLRSLGFDLEGRLWVELSVPEDSSRIADVYGHNGERIGTMVWPAGVRLHHWAVLNNTAFGVQPDSLGTQRIVRLHFVAN
jgi:hypothetical protein